MQERHYNMGAKGSELRETIMEDRWQGTICPICDGHVEVHQLRPDYFMTAGLLLYFLYRPKDGRFATMNELGRGNPQSLIFWRDGLRTFRRWHYWGLIEQESQFIPDGNKDSWRLSKEGIQFVLGNLLIPRDVVVFRGRLIGDGLEAEEPCPTISIDQLLSGAPSREEYKIDVEQLLKSCGKRKTVSPVPVFRKCDQPTPIPQKFVSAVNYHDNPALVLTQLSKQSHPCR